MSAERAINVINAISAAREAIFNVIVINRGVDPGPRREEAGEIGIGEAMEARETTVVNIVGQPRAVTRGGRIDRTRNRAEGGVPAPRATARLATSAAVTATAGATVKVKTGPKPTATSTSQANSGVSHLARATTRATRAARAAARMPATTTTTVRAGARTKAKARAKSEVDKYLCKASKSTLKNKIKKRNNSWLVR
jgi:hypothetical protein